MAERHQPQVYSIAAHRGFADALVAGLVPRYSDPEFGLARLTQLLIPAKVEPGAVRQAELTAVILLLVASNRGVSVLPDWVVREVKYSSDYVTRPLTAEGLTRQLFAATRDEDLSKPYMQDLIQMAGKEARRLQET